MRELLLLLILALGAQAQTSGGLPALGSTWKGTGGASIAFVQAASNNITVACTACTVGNGVGSSWSNVGSGHWLHAIGVGFNPSSVSSCTDSLSTSFTANFLGAFNGFYLYYCYGKTTASGADLITMNLGLSNTPVMIALEFSGLGGATDGTIAGIGPAACTSCTLAGITTTNANDVVIACGGNNSSNATYTAGSGYTIPTNGQSSGGNQSSFCEYQIVSAANTYTPTVTIGSSITIIGGTFAYK